MDQGGGQAQRVEVGCGGGDRVVRGAGEAAGGGFRDGGQEGDWRWGGGWLLADGEGPLWGLKK